MIRRIARNHLVGTKALQRFWEEVHRLSLAGMNVGAAVDVTKSGETWVMEYFVEQVAEGVPGIVFDVGANVGRFTAEMVSRSRGALQIYSFEPSKAAFQRLAQNLQGQNVHIFNLAFGDREEFATLYADSDGSPFGSLYERRLEFAGITISARDQVRVRTVDSFCDEEGIKRIGFLKLDVEGHELKVMMGAKGRIDSGSIDMIQFEFGGCNIDSRTYFKDFYFFLRPRYEIHRILKDGLVLVEQYDERYEAFLPTNYLAIQRKDHARTS